LVPPQVDLSTCTDEDLLRHPPSPLPHIPRAEVPMRQLLDHWAVARDVELWRWRALTLDPPL
jgi:hypothetical protein